jgi:hypothetical protein
MGKRNIDLLREERKKNEQLEAQLEQSRTNVKVLKTECERLVANGAHYTGVPTAADAEKRKIKQKTAELAEARILVDAVLLSLVKRFGLDGDALSIPGADVEGLKTHAVKITRDGKGGYTISVAERQAPKQ